MKNKTFYDIVKRKREEIISNQGICVQDVINLETILKDSFDGEYSSPILKEGVTLTSFTTQRSDQYHQAVIDSLTNILKASEIDSIASKTDIERNILNGKIWYIYLVYLKKLATSLINLDPALIEQIKNVNYVVYNRDTDEFTKKDHEDPLLACIAHTELKDVILGLPSSDFDLGTLAFTNTKKLELMTKAIVAAEDMVIETHANDIAYQILLAIGENRDELVDVDDCGCPREAFIHIKSWITGNIQYDYSMSVNDLIRLLDVVAKTIQPIDTALKWLVKMLGEEMFSSGLITKKLDITWLPALDVRDVFGETTDITLKILTGLENTPTSIEDIDKPFRPIRIVKI